MKIKKIISFILVVSAFQLSAIAKNNDINLQCSFVTQFSDIHFTLKPFTLSENGNIFAEQKSIGNYRVNNDLIDMKFYSNSEILFDKVKGIAVHTLKVDGKNVYSYGSCYKVK